MAYPNFDRYVSFPRNRRRVFLSYTWQAFSARFLEIREAFLETFCLKNQANNRKTLQFTKRYFKCEGKGTF